MKNVSIPFNRVKIHERLFNGTYKNDSWYPSQSPLIGSKYMNARPPRNGGSHYWPPYSTVSIPFNRVKIHEQS